MPTSISALIDHFRREAPGWDPAASVDTLKCGDPATAIDSIAVTMMATPRVIARAAELGAQLIITHEPTFHDHLDQPKDEHDPVVVAKRDLLSHHELLVWRCHDSIHKLAPDGIRAGMVAALGWGEHQDPADERLFTAPAPSLGALVAQARERLGIAAVRWIGDPELKVERVALSPGSAGFGNHRNMLRMPGVNVLVCGEQREWETCEYVRDANQLGLPCGLIVLGHVNSEEAGMRHLTDWLEARLDGVALHFIEAGDPFRHD